MTIKTRLYCRIITLTAAMLLMASGVILWRALEKEMVGMVLCGTGLAVFFVTMIVLNWINA